MKFYQTCRVCKAVFFNKVWHHGDSVKVADLKRHHFAWATRCPACKLIESRRYQGLISITNIPTINSRELLYVIKNIAQQEYQKNCQHRLIEIIKQGPHTWTLTTTNKELADRLARKISQIFDYVDVKSHDTDGLKPVKEFEVEFLPVYYHRFNFEQGW